MAGHRGWIVALIVVFGLAGAGLVALGLLLSDRKTQVKPATTLVLDFRDELIEEPAADARSRLFYKDTPTLWDHLRALDHAAQDPHVEAVLLKIDGIDMGWAKCEELRDKLIELQDHGKKVIAYIEGGEDQDYVLASAAGEIYMAPNSNLFLDGVSSEAMYLKGTLDKVGIQADMEHIGEYKDAAEPLTRTGASDASREASNSLLDETWNTIVSAIVDSRGMDSTAVAHLIDQGPFTSKQALAAGLVDSLVYSDELDALLPGGDGGERIQLSDYLATLPAVEGPSGAPKIAVVHATGTIVSGKSGTDPLWGRTVGSDTFLDALDDARHEAGVKAIVVRIDSPGGEVYASHLMWRGIKQAAGEMPVVASFSDLSASGGYYMAMGADTILADDATITGSIGVVGGKFNLKGLYDKLGVNVETLSRGQNATWLSSTRSFTPAERERYVTEMFDEYRTFVGIVADNRGVPSEDIDNLARGRVWTGGQAYENGLVDEVGGFEDAIDVAKVMAGLKPTTTVRVEVFPRIKRTFLSETLSAILSGEDLEDFSRAGSLGPESRLWNAWARRPAELIGSLARLARSRPLALMPFRLHVH
ncbi:MAG: signal peptide peptidase SppA [Candidatus Eisenbacteria bacterium]